MAQRIVAIDHLRGLVIVLMALDHTRDFFSHANFSPTDLSQTSFAWFFTRWITHFCAPTFIFLAGASAYLSLGTHGNLNRLSLFLLTRGLWIVFLGIVFESPIWRFTLDFSEISGAVLWAIGWSMVVLAGLVFLPMPAIAVFALVLIVGHNLFDSLTAHDLGAAGFLWAVLHSGEAVTISAHLRLYPDYPLIPWIGVMAAGYAFGPLLKKPQPLRTKMLLLMGSGLVLAFLTLRWANLYGDPNPWAIQNTPGFTLLSFLNCHKYPPSLAYLLMTLGPVIAALPLLERLGGHCGTVLRTFGQTPMFFYLLHLPVIMVLSLLNAYFIKGWQALPNQPFPSSFPVAYGYGLPTIYLIWAVIVVALYPLCQGFNTYKRDPRHRLLKYL